MTERIMDLNMVQAFLVNTFQSTKVRVRERNNVVTIEAVTENEYRCPLRGIAKGGTLTVDKFLSMKLADKELEEANDIRLRS